MVYKITCDFKTNIGEYIEKLSKNFTVLFSNNKLYVSNIKTITEAKDKKNIKEAISQECFIEVIGENNLKYESLMVIEWCKNELIKADTEKFEVERQSELRAMMQFIEAYDKELDKILKEGSETANGNTEKETGKTDQKEGRSSRKK